MSGLGKSMQLSIGRAIIPIMAKDISAEAAGLLLDHLMKDAIPVLAVFTSESGAVSKLYGFVDSISAQAGILISSTQGTPSISSTIAAPIGNPAGTGCRFSLEDAPDAELKLKYGDTCLVVHRSGEVLMIFFTAKPAA
jgi:hypothetical protein